MSEIHIRRLDRDLLAASLESLRAVDGDLGWMAWPDSAYFMELPQKWELSLFVEMGGLPIGYALCSRKGDVVWLHRIAIHSSCRGRGVGAKVLREIEKSAVALGLPRVGLKTPHDNVAAVHFYENNGYKPVHQEGEYVSLYKYVSARTVGIHQPNFLPWLGYFYKLFHCDIFVFLDDVQFSKGSYFNRSKVLVQGSDRWLTVPIDRGENFIHRMKPAGPDWINKHLAMLEQNYRRTDFFGAILPGLADVFRRHSSCGLSEINEAAIVHIAELLDIQTPIVRSSSFGLESTSDQRLVELVQRVGGDRYLSGSGGDKYQQPETFADANIALAYSSFSPQPYPQSGAPEFVPGLSILDPLFNLGASGTRALISGAPPPHISVA